MDTIEQHKRSNSSLLLSSLAAGLILGSGAMCIALASQLYPESSSTIRKCIQALFYPLGFIVCIMSETQLFTEQTSTALFPVLDGKANFPGLLKVWTLVLLGNLIGTFCCSIMLYYAEPVIQAQVGFINLYEHLIHFNGLEIVLSAILAGWLMAQGGWLIMSTPLASSQIICIYIVTFIIGFGGLHHSIVGSSEIITGLLHSSNPDYIKGIVTISLAVIGNLLGGGIFVALLNYGHIKHLKK